MYFPPHLTPPPSQSYTDTRTGVTHIYAKQLVNGLEVADGDWNINIDRTGSVLSFGTSFHQGPAPSVDDLKKVLPGSGSSVSPACSALRDIVARHAAHFEELKTILPHLSEEHVLSIGSILRQGFHIVGEFILGGHGAAVSESVTNTATAISDKIRDLGLGEWTSETSEAIENVLTKMEYQIRNMRDHLPVLCPPTSDEIERLERAFSHASSLNEQINDNALPFHSSSKAFLRVLPLLSNNPDGLPKVETIVLNLSVHHEQSLVPTNAPLEPPVEIISGLPSIAQGGVKDGQVKARLVYHQVNVENKEETELALVWKYEVDFGDNFYETYVNAETLELVSVIDWTSDSGPQSSQPRTQRASTNKGGKQKPLPGPSKPAKKPYSYGVFKFGLNDPESGNMTVEHAPWDKIASPAGWNAFPDKANIWKSKNIIGMKTGQSNAFYSSSSSPSDKKGNSSTTWSRFETTMGNNVFAQENWEGQDNWLNNGRPQNSSFIFDYEYGEPEGLRPQEYVDLAVTQLFYTSNMYHDLLYRLGFDEVSGNFQMDNWDKPGRGGDAVICNAQDGSGYNNANFMTPPDGTQPRMRMYIWDTATPYRDGDLDAGIVIHEYSHGLSTRLTGGPMNSGCLGYGEAGGMGEGWGDAMSTFIRQIEEYRANETYAMGAWAANRDVGIRNFQYSASMAVNPSTYKTLDKPGYWGVHAIGEVWAEFLFVLAENLIEKHGFSKTLFPPVDPSKPNDYYRNVTSSDNAEKHIPLIPKHGNSLVVQLIVDGMKLQPCRPSFANARDAIIQADKILTGGENECTIWLSFASRGLGPNARLTGSLPWGGGIRAEDFAAPKLCLEKKPKGPKKPKHL